METKMEAPIPGAGLIRFLVLEVRFVGMDGAGRSC